ncbi:PLP-dependent aminotransferase family protein [Pseudoroseomonas globiformis]|uniref:PLP-dependent aminotransferase family protein n=1 Tax=Teichococcus globiformis TaxID=2307229 RepID=A0ABV7FY97_9PROT
MTPQPPPRISRSIGESIKARIASGQLCAGAPLPSTRALAAEWGVSRTTVTAAYEQLIAEGYVETRRGSRARVARGFGHPALSTEQRAPAPFPIPLSAFARRLEAAPLQPADLPDLSVDFRYGDLASADFPLPAWRKAITAALLRRPPRLRYDDPRGAISLRVALQGYLWRARGLRCAAEQIVVVNGSQQGLDLCARLLLDPGDAAVMEDPGYNLARQIFAAAGASLLPVPADAEGLRTEALPPARLAYVTPSHQFPLGGVLPARRRGELLAWARQAGAFVIEDDYDGEYRYDIAPVPPLLAMAEVRGDAAGRVIYLGTLSKTLSPTLRLGYLVLPAALAPAFAAAKRLTDRHTPALEQEALAGLIESGAYERHVRRMRRRNGERRAALLDALTTMLGDAVTASGAEAGLHILLWLNRLPPDRQAALLVLAREAGLGLHPVAPLYATGQAPAGLVVGYAGLSEAAIRQGVRLLRQVLERLGGA